MPRISTSLETEVSLSLALILGQVLQGMKFDSKPLAGEKNEPMMPIGISRCGFFASCAAVETDSKPI